jgi:hypothetical protein
MGYQKDYFNNIIRFKINLRNFFLILLILTGCNYALENPSGLHYYQLKYLYHQEILIKGNLTAEKVEKAILESRDPTTEKIIICWEGKDEYGLFESIYAETTHQSYLDEYGNIHIDKGEIILKGINGNGLNGSYKGGGRTINGSTILDIEINIVNGNGYFENAFGSISANVSMNYTDTKKYIMEYYGIIYVPDEKSNSN